MEVSAYVTTSMVASRGRLFPMCVYTATGIKPGLRAPLYVLLKVFAGASAGTDRRGSEGPASFPSFRSVMTTTSKIISAANKETTLRVAKTQVP